jgi:hypothetical protein
VQNNAKRRFMNPDAAVVFDKTELAKSIHKEAHTGAGGADHLRQSFLSDPGNVLFWFPRLAELGHQQQNPRQPLFRSS